MVFLRDLIEGRDAIRVELEPPLNELGKG